jgi:hypothetical protein
MPASDGQAGREWRRERSGDEPSGSVHEALKRKGCLRLCDSNTAHSPPFTCRWTSRCRRSGLVNSPLMDMAPATREWDWCTHREFQ